MAVEWKALRLRAGMSLERAGAQAGVTSATAKIFELDPEAIRNPAKRAAHPCQVSPGFARSGRDALHNFRW